MDLPIRENDSLEISRDVMITRNFSFGKNYQTIFSDLTVITDTEIWILKPEQIRHSLFFMDTIENTNVLNVIFSKNVKKEAVKLYMDYLFGKIVPKNCSPAEITHLWWITSKWYCIEDFETFGNILLFRSRKNIEKLLRIPLPETKTEANLELYKQIFGIPRYEYACSEEENAEDERYILFLKSKYLITENWYASDAANFFMESIKKLSL